MTGLGVILYSFYMGNYTMRQPQPRRHRNTERTNETHERAAASPPKPKVWSESRLRTRPGWLEPLHHLHTCARAHTYFCRYFQGALVPHIQLHLLASARRRTKNGAAVGSIHETGLTGFWWIIHTYELVDSCKRGGFVATTTDMPPPITAHCWHRHRGPHQVNAEVLTADGRGKFLVLAMPLQSLMSRQGDDASTCSCVFFRAPTLINPCD